ncbi:MAG: tripartite tricarboxylate transporter permease, partial [Chloroflexi bacterium]|nr:tripartite tricarboxylate transporter permease [Chloroflexota bacterium]
MSVLSYLGDGFATALQPQNLLFALVGVLLGTLVGVLPGIGPTAAIALLIPISAGMDPVTSVIMLAGIYYGSMYGSSTTAILINTPGEAASVVTALDGYQLARQGRAGPALAIAAIASFIAGTFSLIGLGLLAPPLADFALRFGPPEYFSLMLLGLTLVISLAGKSLVKGLLAGAFGLLIAMIGLDPIYGSARFTFGTLELMGGINFISVVVGLFAISEVLQGVEDRTSSYVMGQLKGIWPTREDFRNSFGAMLRGSAVGFFLGILPGSGSAVTSFLSYDLEKKISKHPMKFGTGVIEGVAGPEAANNAATGGGMVPLLTLGIPPSAPLAVLLGALMIHGVRPGPLLFSEHPDFVWPLIASMYIGNVMLLVLNLPLVGLWAKFAQVPFPVLGPIILVLSFIGTYGVRNNMFDVWVALFFGVLGYLMRK